FMMITLRHANT
ncbi:hypothetical protein D049_2334B, partial [Vibrio parahaemolyticus VPTS-2010]